MCVYINIFIYICICTHVGNIQNREQNAVTKNHRKASLWLSEQAPPGVEGSGFAADRELPDGDFCFYKFEGSFKKGVRVPLKEFGAPVRLV